MAKRDPTVVGYCGLACGMCKNACDQDCRHGGGPEDCHQRDCCINRELIGCWECEDFPCDRGFFADDDDPAFRGICIGSVQCIRECGVAEYLRRVETRLGNPVEYGDFRYLDPEEVKNKLCAA